MFATCTAYIVTVKCIVPLYLLYNIF